MVQAILLLMQRALAGAKDYDYYILLSGSDYPIVSKEYIHNFFRGNQGQEFISLVKMPGKGKPISRINTIRFPSSKPIRQFLARILVRLGGARRDHQKYLGNLDPYAGSTWWALTRDACQYIVNFSKYNQSFCRYFEETFASDEMFFHTILGNSLFQPRIHRNVMFDDWMSQGAHPELINEAHIKMFETNEKVIFVDMYGSGEMLFARKFSDDNLAIIEQVHQMISKKSHKHENKSTN